MILDLVSQVLVDRTLFYNLGGVIAILSKQFQESRSLENLNILILFE